MNKRKGNYFITDSGEPLTPRQGNRYGVWIKEYRQVKIVETWDDLHHLTEKYDVPDDRVISYKRQPNK